MSFKSLLRFFFTASTLVLTACSSGENVLEKTGEFFQSNLDRIFATRPQNRTHAIVVYKLKTPALLAGVSLEKKSNFQPSQQQIQAIDDEQKAFIAKAQALSAEVKVIFKYKIILNAVSMMIPLSVESQIAQIESVQTAERSTPFSRPEVISLRSLNTQNSVNFIHSDVAHSQGIRGQGVRVGIIDTGVDYTHKMLGGTGVVADYENTNPSIESSLFPNKKVVGGIDLVGTDYDASSDDFLKNIPHGDANPIDEGGHGTHVAGTVAGIGDGVNTYSGVAPDATIYAIKVFGAKGSTNDDVVMAGLEYAADPNGDLKLEDHLDIVNMSLGSGYGSPRILYMEAIRNLVAGGTVVVASAGNSGPLQHIVGSPSIADEAISVAASIDNSERNWKFRAVRFYLPNIEPIVVEAVESSASKPIVEIDPLRASIVYVGLADTDLSPEVTAQVKGKIALIDRGVVTFGEKMTRAEKAGAVGVIVANNQDTAPFSMGGDNKVKIPAIMIAKSLGTQIKQALKEGADAQIDFKIDQTIEKPELIDTLTGFSSQGPRSLDSQIKPEITAPGYNIISAAMGKGEEGVPLSGTSMSAPHIAGVMALLKQWKPQMLPRQLKSLLMGSAVTIKDEKKEIYPISRQGSGRVDVARIFQSQVLSSPTALSLGSVDVDTVKILEKSLRVENFSGQEMNLTLKFEGSSSIRLKAQNVKLAPSADLVLRFQLTTEGLTKTVNEAGGWVKLYNGDAEVLRVPVLAMIQKVSKVEASQLTIESTNFTDSYGSPVHLTLKNSSHQIGEVLPFNLLGFDSRKPDMGSSFRSKACDLQASGYKIAGGLLQIAVKLYEPVTTWNSCEISVQIDTNEDQIAEQELVGIPLDHLPGMNGADYKTVLLEASKAREIRRQYEASLAAGVKDLKLDYSSAIQAFDTFKAYDHSSVAIVQMSLDQLKLRPNGYLAVKVATSSDEQYAIESDDFLQNQEKEWKKIDTKVSGQAYIALPDSIQIQGQSQAQIDFQKGYGSEDLLLLMPTNKTTIDSLQEDEQSQVVKPYFVIGDL